MKESLNQELLKLIFSEVISQHFEVVSIQEGKDRFDIRLEELKELIPIPLFSSKEVVVLDGFCNGLELQTFVLSGKAVFLQIYRRRWKESGGKEHHSNCYDLNEEGVKATHEFAAFLKEEYGFTPEQHYDYIGSLWGSLS